MEEEEKKQRQQRRQQQQQQQQQQEQEELPEGVLSINDVALGTVEDWDHLDPTELAKMWKRTHASANFVADNIGRRLENYFWRLLCCERLLQSFTGGQILVHVKAINEGGNIRTTPIGSPRASKDLQIYFTTPQTINPFVSTQKSSSMPPSADFAFLPPSTLGEEDDGAATPTALNPNTATERLKHEKRERKKSQLRRPPPILKKAGSSGSSRSTSSRSLVIGTPQVIAETGKLDPSATAESSSAVGGQHTTAPTGSSPTPRYTSTRFSEEVAVSIPQTLSSTSGGKGEKSPRPFGDPSPRSSKRGLIVHGALAASRKRTIVMRQRSSQTSSQKPSPTSPSLGPQQQTEDEDLTMVVNTGRRRRAASPHPDRRGPQASFTPSSDENEEEEEVSSGEDPNEDAGTTKEKTKENASPTSRLVDPNFRSNFASQAGSIQNRSFTNLPSAAWRSTAAAPAAVSYQASGMMLPEQASSSGRRESGRAAFKDEIIPLKAPAPAGPDITSEAQDVTTLPRTKSQLTLLLERNQAAGDDPKGKGPAKQ